MSSQNEYLSPSSSIRAVIAIDFGTSGTAFAFTFNNGSSNPDIFKPQRWDGNAVPKDFTAIAYDDHQNILAVGYAAVALASQRRSNAKLFSEFKMHLYNSVTTSTMIQADNDCNFKLPLLDVISNLLEQYKHQALAMINLQVDRVVHIKENEVRWVLTIPAIWSESSKGFMERAAINARFPRENLLFALEPEAAALCTLKTSVVPTVGTSFLVADCGGGTIDVTVLDLQAGDSSVREVIPASGNNWGSTQINKALYQLIKDLIGQKFNIIETPGHFKDLQFLKEQIERLKLSSQGGGEIRLPPCIIPSDIVKRLGQFNEQQGLSLEYGDQDLFFSKSSLNKICQNQIKQVEDHLKSIVATRPVERIFIVGGFSDDERLKSAIKGNISIEVIIPSHPSDAVVRGAVYFGLRPNTIVSRCARKTYGVRTSVNFDPSIHPASKRYELDGKSFCGDQFTKFVTIGESLPFNHVVSHDLHPLVQRQSEISFPVYQSTLPNPKYTDEFGCQLMGTLTMVDYNIHQCCDQRVFKTELHFGGTILKLRVIDKDGREQNYQMNFVG
jgi:molecular chaperone DnaK (HSP70)